MTSETALCLQVTKSIQKSARLQVQKTSPVAPLGEAETKMRTEHRQSSPFLGHNGLIGGWRTVSASRTRSSGSSTRAKRKPSGGRFARIIPTRKRSSTLL